MLVTKIVSSQIKAFLDDDIEKISKAYDIAKRTKRTVIGNIIFAKYGIAPPLLAVKTSDSVGKVLAKNIPYDSRLGKGKQTFVKAKIKSIHEYKS